MFNQQAMNSVFALSPDKIRSKTSPRLRFEWRHGFRIPRLRPTKTVYLYSNCRLGQFHPSHRLRCKARDVAYFAYRRMEQFWPNGSFRRTSREDIELYLCFETVNKITQLSPHITRQREVVSPPPRSQCPT